jgi:hypothetical protein
VAAELGAVGIPVTGAARQEAAYDEARAALLLGQMVYDRRTALGQTQAAMSAGMADNGVVGAGG